MLLILSPDCLNAWVYSSACSTTMSLLTNHEFGVVNCHGIMHIILPGISHTTTTFIPPLLSLGYYILSPSDIVLGSPSPTVICLGQVIYSNPAILSHILVFYLCQLLNCLFVPQIDLGDRRNMKLLALEFKCPHAHYTHHPIIGMHS